MRYDYQCQNEECQNVQEEEHSMNGFKEFHPECKECGSLCDYKWFPTPFQFALKDGPSGVAPGKALRVNEQMRKRSEAAGRRQKDRYGHIKKDIIPNLDGQEKASWREAQADAIKEYGLEKASGFNQKIAEEKANPGKLKT